MSEIGTYEFPKKLVDRLIELGILPDKNGDTRNYNIGASDYSIRVIQPWSIWQEYEMNPWDADIQKRLLRNKSTDSRKMDYEKIIHICKERIRQIDNKENQ